MTNEQVSAIINALNSIGQAAWWVGIAILMHGCLGLAA